MRREDMPIDAMCDGVHNKVSTIETKESDMKSIKGIMNKFSNKKKQPVAVDSQAEKRVELERLREERNDVHRNMCGEKHHELCVELTAIIEMDSK